jgi:hypothetical protein
MEPASPYDEYPFFGRHANDHAHAPYVIVRSLIGLGLADWSATLLGWLGRYDGIEQHLGDDYEPDPRFDPAVCVRDVLIRHAAIWPSLALGKSLTPDQRRQRIAAITLDLLELEFVGANAAWYGPRRAIWNPLGQDWLRFIEMGPDLAELRQMAEGEGLLDAWINPESARYSRAAIRRLLLDQTMEEGAR